MGLKGDFIFASKFDSTMPALPACLNGSAPFELPIASASILTLLLVITVPTNLLVCLAILVDPNRELRTQFNIFTFNLSLADLIVACVAEPGSIYDRITKAFASERGHKVSQIGLKMFWVLYPTSIMASVLSIVALACERFFAINSPFGYRKYFNVKVAVVISIVIWAAATVFALQSFISHDTVQSFMFVYSTAVFTGVVMCFTYYKIRHSWRKTSKQWAENGIRRERDISIQNRLTKAFALMIGTLMLCYVPACAMVYYMGICTDCNCIIVQWFNDANFWLVLLNSAIDPYVYAIRSSAFRDAIRKIITCKCRHPNKLQTLPSVRFSKAKSEDQQKQIPTYGSLDTSRDNSRESCQIQQAPLIKT